jgi:hypothetical protein
MPFCQIQFRLQPTQNNGIGDIVTYTVANASPLISSTLVATASTSIASVTVNQHALVTLSSLKDGQYLIDIYRSPGALTSIVIACYDDANVFVNNPVSSFTPNVLVQPVNQTVLATCSRINFTLTFTPNTQPMVLTGGGATFTWTTPLSGTAATVNHTLPPRSNTPFTIDSEDGTYKFGVVRPGLGGCVNDFILEAQFPDFAVTNQWVKQNLSVPFLSATTSYTVLSGIAFQGAAWRVRANWNQVVCPTNVQVDAFTLTTTNSYYSLAIPGSQTLVLASDGNVESPYSITINFMTRVLTAWNITGVHVISPAYDTSPAAYPCPAPTINPPTQSVTTYAYTLQLPFCMAGFTVTPTIMSSPGSVTLASNAAGVTYPQRALVNGVPSQQLNVSGPSSAQQILLDSRFDGLYVYTVGRDSGRVTSLQLTCVLSDTVTTFATSFVFLPNQLQQGTFQTPGNCSYVMWTMVYSPITLPQIRTNNTAYSLPNGGLSSAILLPATGQQLFYFETDDGVYVVNIDRPTPGNCITAVTFQAQYTPYLVTNVYRKLNITPAFDGSVSLGAPGTLVFNISAGIAYQGVQWRITMDWNQVLCPSTVVFDGTLVPLTTTPTVRTINIPTVYTLSSTGNLAAPYQFRILFLGPQVSSIVINCIGVVPTFTPSYPCPAVTLSPAFNPGQSHRLTRWLDMRARA